MKEAPRLRVADEERAQRELCQAVHTIYLYTVFRTATRPVTTKSFLTGQWAAGPGLTMPEINFLSVAHHRNLLVCAQLADTIFCGTRGS